MLFTVENKILIMDSSNACRFEFLVQEEKVLTQEIIAFDNKLESWPLTCIPSAQVMTTSKKLIEHQSELETIVPPSVVAFEVSSC